MRLWHAPVGKQAPPTRAAPSLVRALRDARGTFLFATGTSLFQRRRGVLFACRSGVLFACRLTPCPAASDPWPNPQADRADTRLADWHRDWPMTVTPRLGSCPACPADRNIAGSPRPNAAPSW